MLLEVQHSETLNRNRLYSPGRWWAVGATNHDVLETITKNGREVERFRKIESEILIKPISGNK